MTTTTIPSTIGPYRIDRELGRGGMGVVFLGHDSRLDRAVAIKALSPEVAADPERLQRFEREAKLLASLSHPNIAAIYGVEESDGARYLILEHVEGESLAERLSRGPLPLADTLDICHQIASGIEAAHEGGVIHRDLKPGNVMITPNDVVKVLDFGLAKGKVADSDPGQSPTFPNSPTFPQSPTIAPSPTYHSPTTLPGVVLGTAAYLSPEQARGKPVDRRTDIWSFGCVLYQCLTGRMAFEGETVSDTIARILDRDVDWSRLPENTPPAIRALLERCLEIDAKKRLRDMGDVRLAFEEPNAGRSVAPAAAAPVAAPAKKWFGAKTGVIFGLGIVAGGALALNLWGALGWGGGGSRGNRLVTRASILIPAGLQVLQWEIAPDGRAILILAQPRKTAKGEEPRSQVYSRRMDQSAFEPIRGTDRAQAFMLSADGKWIAFVAPTSERSTQTQVLKMPADGSAPPVPIAKVDVIFPRRPSWLESGDFLIPSANGKEYIRQPSTGSPPSKPRPFDAPGYDGTFVLRRPLPGDRGVLLDAISYEGGAYQLGVGVLDIKSGKTKILIRDAGSGEYSPTGHLLFTRGNTLLAVPFDLGRLEVKGEPVALQAGLRVVTSNGNADVRLASNGTLLYVLGGNVGQDRHAVVVDAGGRISEWSGERQPFDSLVKASPDGSRFVATIGDAGGIYEIWVSERGAPNSRRVIAVPGVDAYIPEWSPDGAMLAFNQNGPGDVNGVYVAKADGSGAVRRIVKGEEGNPIVPTSWSPDGAQLLCCSRLRSGRSFLMVAPASQPHEVAATMVFGGDDAHRFSGCFSPDGRMLAYMSNETGKVEAHVCRWEQGGPVGQPLQASRTGASYWLRWSRNGRRLYYESSQNQVVSVAISTTPRLSASDPEIAWDLDALRAASEGGGALIDLLADGKLLVIQKGESEDELTRYDIAFNFLEELRSKFRKSPKG